MPRHRSIFVLDDERGMDMLADDRQKRRVAFAEGLLGVDEIEHRVDARQIAERRSTVGGIDRGQPRRVGDDIAVFEKRRRNGDLDEARRRVIVVGGVVHGPLLVLADGDEAREPVERNPLLASGGESRDRACRGSVGQLGDRGRRRVHVDGQEPAHDALFLAQSTEQRVQEKRFSAGELTDGRERCRAREAFANLVDQTHGAASAWPRVESRVGDQRACGGDERQEVIGQRRELVTSE